MALRPSLAVDFQALAHLKAGNICVGNNIDFLDLAHRVQHTVCITKSNKREIFTESNLNILFHTGAGQ